MVNIMTSSEWIYALFGGCLIGLAATVLMGGLGRIAGISGALQQWMGAPLQRSQQWRLIWLLAIIAGGQLASYAHLTQAMSAAPEISWPLLIGGGLVGLGTVWSNGCTSGHGVCGLARLSIRSLVAVLVFVSVGMLTAYLVKL